MTMNLQHSFRPTGIWLEYSPGLDETSLELFRDFAIAGGTGVLLDGSTASSEITRQSIELVREMSLQAMVTIDFLDLRNAATSEPDLESLASVIQHADVVAVEFNNRPSIKAPTEEEVVESVPDDDLDSMPDFGGRLPDKPWLLKVPPISSIPSKLDNIYPGPLLGFMLDRGQTVFGSDQPEPLTPEVVVDQLELWLKRLGGLRPVMFRVPSLVDRQPAQSIDELKAYAPHIASLGVSALGIDFRQYNAYTDLGQAVTQLAGFPSILPEILPTDQTLPVTSDQEQNTDIEPDDSTAQQPQTEAGVQETDADGEQDFVLGSALVSYQFSSETLTVIRAAFNLNRHRYLSERDIGVALVEAGISNLGEEFDDCRFLATWVKYGEGYPILNIKFDTASQPFDSSETLKNPTQALRSILDSAKEIAQSVAGSPVIAARHLICAVVIGVNPQVSTHSRKRLESWAEFREAFYFEVTRSWPNDDIAAWKMFLIGIARTLVAGYDADTTVGELEDKLDVERYAESLAAVICSWDVDPPLSLGIFGDWGSGKTFFLQLLEKHIEIISQNRSLGNDGLPLFCEKIVNVKFNAWHYAEADLWASLVQTIFLELGRALSQGDENSDALNRIMKELGVATEMRAEAKKRLTEAKTAFKTQAETVSEKTKNYGESSSSLANHIRSNVLDSLQDATLDGDVRLDQAVQVAETYFGVTDLAGKYGTIDTKIGVIAKVLSDDRIAAARAKTPWQWLANSPIKKGEVFLLAVIFISILAIGGVGTWALRAWVGSSWSGISTLVLEVGTMLSIGIAWARKHLGTISRGLSQWDSVQATLNERLRKAEAEKETGLADERTRLKALLKELEGEQEALARAERSVEEATKAVEESTTSQTLSRFIEQRLKEGDYAERLGIVARIRDDFERLSDFMLKNKIKLGDSGERSEAEGKENGELPRIDRIVLYIDDLDRCPADTVVDVLEAIHLILAFPLFVVVVGVDLRWAAQSLHQRFPMHLSEGGWLPSIGMDVSETADNGAAQSQQQPLDPGLLIGPKAAVVANAGSQQRASALDYLEKIFQIPFWLPPMNEAASKNLIAKLLPADSAQNRATELQTNSDVGKAAPSSSISIPSRARIEGEQAIGFEERGNEETEAPAEAQSNLIGATAPAGALAQPNGPPIANDDSLADQDGIPRQLEETKNGPQLEALTIQPLERAFMLELAAAVGRSPRRLKRFVNTYRMLKAACTPLEKSRFVVGDGESGEYRAAMSLLALVTGAPHHAPMILSELLKQNDSVQLSEFVKIMESFRAQNEALELEYAVRAFRVYQSAVERSAGLQELRYWAVRVTRFSFRSGPL